MPVTAAAYINIEVNTRKWVGEALNKPLTMLALNPPEFLAHSSFARPDY